MRIADVLAGKLTEMHQPAVVEADVDEGPEINHVQHRAHEFHAHGKVLEFEHALLEERLGEVFAGIAARPGELLEDVRQKQPAHAQFSGERLEIDRDRLLRERLGLLPRRQVGHAATEPLEHLLRNGIAFRVDPGRVERIRTTGDLEEAHRLHVGRFTEAGNLQELLPRRERAVLGPPFVEVLGGGLIEARHPPEERGAGGVHIDTDIVDATLNHVVERGMEVPRLHVVLVEPDADVRGLDLHKFRERIL